jgi:hypothetical protein
VPAESGFAAQLRLAGERGILLTGYTSYEDHKGNVDPTCVLQSMTIDGKPYAPTGGMGHYIIDLTYSTIQLEKQPEKGGPWVWSVRAGLAAQMVDLDVNGVTITNSAYEPPEQPLTALVPEIILHGEGYVQAADEVAAFVQFLPYIGTLNASPYRGAARGCLFVHPIQTQPADGGWIRVAVDLQHRKPKTLGNTTYEGWQDVFEDKGTREKITGGIFGDYQKIRIDDEAGGSIPADRPVPLDGNGAKAATGAAPSYRVVNHYTYSDFNTAPWS